MSEILEDIAKRVGEVKTGNFDMTFGEIINLHSNKELIISPEYQRLFRWSGEQKSRLIESILLELPIPQIFLVEDEHGVMELIDGLQRISSLIQFVNPKLIDKEPLCLDGCDIITSLNGLTYDDLPMKLQLRIKRSSVRAVVIKSESEQFLKYEMFKRLNTGGENLAPQEIRNCSSRMVGEHGETFYNFLQSCAKKGSFETCVSRMSDTVKEMKGDEELVLRFFALKNSPTTFKGSVRDWLDRYMEDVLKSNIDFDYVVEEQSFDKVFEFLSAFLSDGAFTRYKNGESFGALAPAYFEAVTMGVKDIISDLEKLAPGVVKEKIIEIFNRVEFLQNVGPGASSKSKMMARIQSIKDGLKELIADK
ncbi:MAG: DUF262 domain-containing protein [Desulfobulbaceae bacterium]|nr:DUF262 domain-containing protein [Desulfobulbaceae bacterium]